MIDDPSSREALKKLISSHVPTPWVLDEIPLAGNKVIADLFQIDKVETPDRPPVVLTGIEIKSQKDRLNRLPGQIEAYGKVFHYCFVACVEQHLREVTKVVPSWWGVYKIDWFVSRVRAKLHRPATRNPVTDVGVGILGMLWKHELEALLVARGVSKIATTREAIEAQVASVYALYELPEILYNSFRTRQAEGSSWAKAHDRR